MRLINENDVYALFGRNGTACLHVGHIDRLPRADAVEVVHGRWIERPSNPNQVYCSECTMILETIANAFNYCPNCGAKMDGGVVDATD